MNLDSSFALTLFSCTARRAHRTLERMRYPLVLLVFAVLVVALDGLG